MAYEVRIPGNGVASNYSCANASEELLAGDHLLAEQVPASLRLHLIFDVHRRDTGTVVLLDGSGDHGGSTEAIFERMFLDDNVA